MMNTEILQEFTASNDQIIVKGKRTKRLRPSSSTSSSGGGGVFNYNSSTTSSLTTSTSTQEDEDMANCLILLARGRGGFSEEDEIKPPENKFRSRKFTEMATTSNGKVGIYVYECKTCSRTFASFQALGGHRASHKKPKAAADSDQAKSPPCRSDEEEIQGKLSKVKEITPSTSTVVQLPKIEIKSKIHECSICGSEFSSGQALGGHMRRHRSAINGRSGGGGEDVVGDEKSRNLLALDLNLPAPAEEERREAEFHQYQQQPRLVDCHY